MTSEKREKTDLGREAPNKALPDRKTQPQNTTLSVWTKCPERGGVKSILLGNI